MSDIDDNSCLSAATDGAFKQAKSAIDQPRLRGGR
jgi:hypothetical protein